MSVKIKCWETVYEKDGRARGEWPPAVIQDLLNDGIVERAPDGKLVSTLSDD